MKCSYHFLLAFLLVTNLCTAQSYKGIFFGTNASKIANDARFNDWFIGWHFGYAVRGDLKKPVVPQLELIASVEGGSNKDFDVRAVTCFLKTPLLMSAKLDKQSPLRAIFGIQPTIYMGGFTKLGHPIYRPYFRKDDDNKYQQPDLLVAGEKETFHAPRNWNFEAVFGFEICQRKTNYGVRANLGLLSKDRFMNSSLSLRFGF